MRGTTARTLANVVLVTAGVAAAYVVITTPRSGGWHCARRGSGWERRSPDTCCGRPGAPGWSRVRLPDIIEP